MTFEYDASLKLVGVKTSGYFSQSAVASYDDKGRIKTYIQKFYIGSQLNRTKTNTFSYNADGKLAKIDCPECVSTTQFGHDSKGRLISVDNGYHIISYEYDNDDNVAKATYAIKGSIELPHSSIFQMYDTNVPFYGDSKELKLLCEYLFLIVPSRNNATKVLWQGGINATQGLPGTLGYTLEPVNVEYAVRANERGYTTARSRIPTTTEPAVETFTFSKTKYTCD